MKAFDFVLEVVVLQCLGRRLVELLESVSNGFVDGFFGCLCKDVHGVVEVRIDLFRYMICLGEDGVVAIRLVVAQRGCTSSFTISFGEDCLEP